MAGLALKGITKSFGPVPVLSDIDLDIADGEFITLVGPSGCGKSTLLRIIAGLETQDRGTVSIGGRPVDHLRPHERKAAMVFQNYALYPHMTVFDNIALPLTMARLTLPERVPILRWLSWRRRRIMAGITKDARVVAEQLRIEAYFDRRPGELSGGQRQRVALGRAMVRHPDVFLMDEPLSNLDAKLRTHMRSELAELHARLGVTMVYVTHDQVEAMTMADRLAVMDQGVILQLGSPDELYERPNSLAVAQFIGSPAINLLAATVGANGRLELQGRVLPVHLAQEEGSAITIGIRPEALRVGAGHGAITVACRYRRRENLGAERILHFESIADAAPILCRVTQQDGQAEPRAGEVVDLAFEPRDCHFFAADGARVAAMSMEPDDTATARARGLAQMGEKR